MGIQRHRIPDCDVAPLRRRRGEGTLGKQGISANQGRKESKTQKGPHRQGMYSEAGSVHAEIAVASKDPLRTKALVRASRHGKQQSAEI